MATDLDTVRTCLTAHGLVSLPVTDDCLLVPVRHEGVPLKIGISLMEDGEYLMCRTHGLAKRPASHPGHAAALATAARLNEQFRFVRIGYDPKDGELTVSGEIPLEDARLDPQAFDLAFLATLHVGAALHAALEGGDVISAADARSADDAPGDDAAPSSSGVAALVAGLVGTAAAGITIVGVLAVAAVVLL